MVDFGNGKNGISFHELGVHSVSNAKFGCKGEYESDRVCGYDLYRDLYR